MRCFIKWVSCCALVISVIAAHSYGQAKVQQPRSGKIAFDTTVVLVGFHLLQRNDVRNHLNLTPKQSAVWNKARPLLFKDYDSMSEASKARDAAVSVRSALTQMQRDRLYQLQLQVVGAFAFSNEEIEDKVGLSKSQKKRVYDVRVAGMRKFQDEMKREGKAYRADPATTEWIKKRILAVLTPAQMKKWKALQGEPFIFSPPLKSR